MSCHLTAMGTWGLLVKLTIKQQTTIIIIILIWCFTYNNICKHCYYKWMSKFYKVLISAAEVCISLVLLPQFHPVRCVIVDIIIEQCWRQETVNTMALIIKNVSFLSQGVNCNTVKRTAWLVPAPWHFYWPRGPFKGHVSVSVGMFHSFLNRQCGGYPAPSQDSHTASGRTSRQEATEPASVSALLHVLPIKLIYAN